MGRAEVGGCERFGSADWFVSVLGLDLREPPPFPHSERRTIQGLFRDETIDDLPEEGLIRIPINLWAR